MNEPLPGAVSAPSEDETEAGAPEGTLAAAPEARVRTEEEIDGDFDEEREDEDDEDRARRAAVLEAAQQPPVAPILFSDVVSGQFDAQAEDTQEPAPKRVL